MATPMSLSVIALALSLAAAAGNPAMAAEGSGEPWGARDPAPCVPLKQPAGPDIAQAIDLIRCQEEIIINSDLWLLENFQIEMGAGIPLDAAGAYEMPNAVLMSTVYPLRGSFTRYRCIKRSDVMRDVDPDRNCDETIIPKATGVCWWTSFGEWQCLLRGAVTETREHVAPPR